MTLTKKQRASVFAMFDGKCAYCGCDLPAKGWHADHIQPIDREWWKAHLPPTKGVWNGKEVVMVAQDRRVTPGHPERDCIENIFPACAPCNLDKGPQSVEGWRSSLEQKVRVLRDNYSAFRHAERFGLVVQIESKVIFYFERTTL